ncbi:CMRF35-like molecule 3 isoform X1 [Hippocampus comes]|uniref:CMRF35-like molecule 3 isoform X1 n=2 Tax=Hippocampus comes TaxID=109280 RepID=UPI00094E282B|nr:PREDICTED: CMRF35-like molecule 3 isoform X1 [Hippocampus comes]
MSKRRMKHYTVLLAPLLFILWLPKQSAVPDELKAPKVVRGAFGESLTVPCRYQPQFRNNTKYWCRGPIYELCKIVAKTPKQRNHDRWSIADDKEAGVFIVTMRALRPSDKDMYWCVVARPGRNIFTGVKISLSNKVITPTSTVPENSSETNEAKTWWWEPLRWILFLTMLFSLVSTHLAAWMFMTARKRCHPNVVHQQNSNIYE